MTGPTLAQVRRRLVQLLPVGAEVGSQGRVVDVRFEGDGAVVVFRWGMNRQTFGVKVAMVAVDESPWTGLPVKDADQWVWDVMGLLQEELDTGLVLRAARRRVDDHIRLSVSSTWPVDGRFYTSVVVAGDTRATGRAGDVGDTDQSEIDPGPTQVAREAGTLIARVYVSLNSPTGGPRVAQAVVRWTLEGEGLVSEFGEVELAEGLPPTVLLELAHRSVHVAAQAGAERVVTSLRDDRLALLGFKSEPDGFSVETSLLNEDFAGALDLLRSTQ